MNTQSGRVSPLRQIMAVWRPYRIHMVFGLIHSLAAAIAGLALMALSGTRLAGMAVGVGFGYFALRVAGLGRIVLRYAERLKTHDATFRALAALRVWFFDMLARGAGAGLGFRRSGDLLTRLVTDIGTLDNLYLRLALPLAGAIITLPILALATFSQSILLGLCVCVLFAVVAFVAPWFVARLSGKAGAALLLRESALREAALDLTSGLRETRAFGAEAMMAATLTARQDALYDAQEARARKLALAGGASSLLGQIAVLCVLLAMCGIGLPQVSALRGVALLFLTIAAFEGVSGLIRSGVLAGDITHAAARIVEVAQDPHPVQASAPAPVGTGLAFENVSFRWSETRPMVLQSVSLDIPQGARIAILGPSGAGKSSLAALLLRAASPQSGRVAMGGVDLAAIDEQVLRARMAWLSQATHLFTDTIRENLTLGREGFSDDALYASLDKAAIGEFVRSLPDGLDTWLGEGGVALSGGQGRRVALARALLSDAPVLVLDEPATGLDADTERAFLETLFAAEDGRTIVLIAHRLTGAERLDQVWRLDHGRLAAQPL